MEEPPAERPAAFACSSHKGLFESFPMCSRMRVSYRRLKTLDDAEAGASTADYPQLEQLYALKRADAVKAASKDLTTTPRGLLDDLRFKGDSGLSLRTREAAAAAFSPLAATVRGGGVVEQEGLSDKARAYLDLERQLYGSPSAYFAKLAEVTGLTAKAITNAGGSVTAITAPAQQAAQAAAV